MALDRAREKDGRVRLRVAGHADKRAEEMDLDPLDFIHAVTLQIPDPKQHMTRSYGAYANRARRRSWARLLRHIYEADPLTCPRCGVPMRIVAVITDPVVVDRILSHRLRRELASPFESRALPAA